MTKKLLFTLFGVLICLSTSATNISKKQNLDDCQTAYQDATYGYRHIKKSFKAYNLEHLKEFAQRAVEAINKVDNATKNCGCTSANDKAYDALQNLNMALEKDTFERSRNFIETAKSNIQQILVELDVCAAPTEINEIAETEGDLAAQEEQLRLQQEALLEQQKKLQEQLAKQKLAKEKLQLEKTKKIALQKKIKGEAESNLQELEALIASLSKTMDCKKPISTGRSFNKSTSELENEPLASTKAFYALKAQELANELINNLDNCK